MKISIGSPPENLFFGGGPAYLRLNPDPSQHANVEILAKNDDFDQNHNSLKMDKIFENND